MRKLRIFEHISLEGVIQATADENNFPYGDWSAAYRTPSWQRDAACQVWREVRFAAWPAHLRYVVGLLAEGAEQSYV